MQNGSEQQNSEKAEETRLSYHAPRLSVLGPIQSLVQSSGGRQADASGSATAT
jgi:hypothetical protein